MTPEEVVQKVIEKRRQKLEKKTEEQKKEEHLKNEAYRKALSARLVKRNAVIYTNTDFEFEESIGSGIHAEIFKMQSQRKKNRYFAGKVCYALDGDDERKQLKKTLDLLPELDHENIAMFFGIFRADRGLQVMEMSTEGSLDKKHQDEGFVECCRVKALHDVSSALYFLHEQQNQTTDQF